MHASTAPLLAPQPPFCSRPSTRWNAGLYPSHADDCPPPLYTPQAALGYSAKAPPGKIPEPERLLFQKGLCFVRPTYGSVGLKPPDPLDLSGAASTAQSTTVDVECVNLGQAVRGPCGCGVAR